MASLVVSGDTSGAITIAAPAIAGTNTLTLPASTGTLVVTGGAQTIEFADGTVSAPSITNSGDTNTGIFFPAADTIAFTEGGAESMRIDSSGNLLVGGTSTAPFSGTSGLGVTRATTPAIYISQTQSTGGYTAKDYVNYIAADGALAWYDTTALSERMRITSGGSLLIGCTAFPSSSVSGMGITGASSSNASSSGTSTSTYNHWLFYNGNGIVGNINTSGSATAYVTSSDYRLKENIAPMTGALAKIAQLKPVTYTWKSDGTESQGFIAHELQAVVPDCVIGEKDAVDADGNIKPQGVDTSFLVATLTAALQEQQQIINDLKARIETLENT
jgi:hypothetical protein